MTEAFEGRQRKEWLRAEAELTERYERVREALLAAIESGRGPRPDWTVALSDAVQDIDRIVQRNAHPDDVGWARLAVSSLAHVWLTAEEVEAIYLGET